MAILEKHQPWVKAEITFQVRRAELLESQGNEAKAARHRELVEKLTAILADVEALERELLAARDQIASNRPVRDPRAPFASPLPDSDSVRAILSNPTVLSPTLLSELPPEVLEQISISETDKFEANVVMLVSAAAGSTMLLDNILVGLYLMTKETHPRTQLANRLYRMMRKGLLFSVPGKKGWYTTQRPEGAEQESLALGDDEAE